MLFTLWPIPHINLQKYDILLGFSPDYKTWPADYSIKYKLNQLFYL